MSSPEDAKPEHTSYQWYSTEQPNLRQETRQLLESYSKIPPDEILPHVNAIVCLEGLTCHMRLY